MENLVWKGGVLPIPTLHKTIKRNRLIAMSLVTVFMLWALSIHYHARLSPLASICVNLYDQNIRSVRIPNREQPTLANRINKIFLKEGVAKYWLSLARIESNGKIDAISAKGARGLFQLMPDTARRFGLRVDHIDERLDPVKSAGAAAKYLRFLHEKFNSWPLAFAAYNAGEGRIESLLECYHARTYSQIEPFLPSETRSYVPKVLALWDTDQSNQTI